MSENSGPIEENQTGDAGHIIDVHPESISNLTPPADTTCEDSGTCSNEGISTGEGTFLGLPSVSKCPNLMSDLTVPYAPQPMEANLSLAESKGVTSFQDSSDKSSNGQGTCMEGLNAASVVEQKVTILKRKLPDLPADVEPLKAMCTTMSQQVVQLLCQIEENQSEDTKHIDVRPESNLAPADTKCEDSGTCLNESISTDDRTFLGLPSVSKGPNLMNDSAVLCASLPTEANLSLAESKCVTRFQDSSDKLSNGLGNCMEGNAASAVEQKVSILKKKLPDLPADLEPLKVMCTTMSQEVLQMLGQIEESQSGDARLIDVHPESNLAPPADTMCEESGTCSNESISTDDRTSLGLPSVSKGPNLMNDSAVLCASLPTEANLSLAESKCVTRFQDSSDKLSNISLVGNCIEGTAASAVEQKVSIPKKKLPDLPADLEPLKVRCTTMPQEVLQLLGQKIKEDIIKTKDNNDIVRTQQLRELSWKVTDMIALGSSVVRQIENKSPYQLQREREAKKYRNKKNRKWNQPQFDMGPNENQYGDHSRQQNQRNRNDRRGRGRGGRRDYGNRNNSDTDQNWRKSKFNTRDAVKRFANFFIKDIISKAVTQFMKEEEERIQLRMSKEVDMAVQLVDTIIAKSIQTIIVESAPVKNNLSLTEAELLSDMCEESMCDNESFLMDISENLSIKTEPTCGG